MIDHTYNSLLFLWKVIEFLDDVSHCWTSILSYTCYRVRAKFEEHWEEFRVNCFTIKQFGIVTQILSQYKFKSPFLLICLLKWLNNIFDEYFALFIRHLLQENMEIFQSCQFDIHDLVFQKSFHTWQKILTCVLRSKNLSQLVDRSW